ncbi:uncharacterized protein IL334_005210 [Kwoniella shivajii]|uniref:C2H2-type domain-containing protein n=1 Tax=Kwoniella shivajii TaxID=564305 RepID=A0ABZ1D3Z7_9TREE|nr:hypothetical protein IL334_005210 [Kwoniella shivajii]
MPPQRETTSSPLPLASSIKSLSPGPRGLYLCPYCSRGFNKHEHLQRHERAHTITKPFQCTACDRKFSRQDSMQRHLRLKHRSASQSVIELSAGEESLPILGGSEPPFGFSPTAVSLPAHPEAGRPYDADTVGSSIWLSEMMDPPSSTLRTTLSGHDPKSLPNGDTFRTVPEATHTSTSSTLGISSTNESAQTVATYPEFDTVDFPIGAPPSGDDMWQLLSEEILPGSHSLHASPHFLAELGLDANAFFQSSTDPVSRGPQCGDVVQDTDSYLDRGSFEGPSLSSNAVNVEERGEFALSATSTMMARMSSSIPTEVPPLSSELLALCLNMFWTRIWPTYPLIHPSTFNMRQTSAPLLINMVALGSLATQNKNIQIKGTSLWNLTNRSIILSWNQLIENRGPYDACKGVQLIQTLALGSLFASTSASPFVVNAAGMSLANGFRWSQLAGVDDPQIVNRTFLVAAEEQLTDTELETRWRRWATLEDLKRSLNMLYSMDCSLAAMTGLPTTGRHLSIPYGGPWDDEASYLAANAGSWRKAINSSRSKVPSVTYEPLANMFQYFFKQDTSFDNDLASLSFMSRGSILDGLTSLILDASRPQYVTGFGLADLQSTDRALSRFYTVFLHRTPDLRTQSVLIGLWHERVIMLGNVIGKQKGHLGSQLWKTPLGRHILLHANSIRQIMENIRLGRAKIPMANQVQVAYAAATVFRDYVEANSINPTTLSAGSYSLNMTVDWQQLNHSMGSCCSGESVDISTSSSPLNAKDFIIHGGTPVLHGLQLSSHDIDPFMTVLAALGRTFPRAEALASALSDKIL